MVIAHFELRSLAHMSDQMTPCLGTLPNQSPHEHTTSPIILRLFIESNREFEGFYANFHPLVLDRIEKI